MSEEQARVRLELFGMEMALDPKTGRHSLEIGNYSFRVWQTAERWLGSIEDAHVQTGNWFAALGSLSSTYQSPEVVEVLAVLQGQLVKRLEADQVKQANLDKAKQWITERFPEGTSTGGAP